MITILHTVARQQGESFWIDESIPLDTARYQLATGSVVTRPIDFIDLFIDRDLESLQKPLVLTAEFDCTCRLEHLFLIFDAFVVII